MGDFDFKWCDLLAVVHKHYSNAYKSITADDINDAIHDYVYKKYCIGCDKEKRCHDECVYCDDMGELLERLGFEV